MTVKEIALQFRVDDKIRCKINMGVESGSWFTGTIFKIGKVSHDECELTIQRDDQGNGFYWISLLTPQTKHLIQPIIGDWDL